MLTKLLILTTLINWAICEKPRILSSRPMKHFVVKTTEATTTTETSQVTSFPFRSPFIKESLIPKRKKGHSPKMIQYSQLDSWAKDIASTFTQIEAKVVRRDVLFKGFSDVKVEVRNGATIVETMASVLEAVLETRVHQAEAIMRHAESLAKGAVKPPPNYVFDRSFNLHELKQKELPDPDLEEQCSECRNNCTSLNKIPVENNTHFQYSTLVNMDISSVQNAADVYHCDFRVLPDIYWSEGLLSTFQKNYALDAMTDFQYFCSVKGFIRHYPASSWTSMFNMKLGVEDDEEEGPADVFDCRLRPWYVAAGGAPRDVLVLLDASGSMHNSSNKVYAETFTTALLSALTDDDQVNVLRFNYFVKSPISCFNDKLVPANHVNSAAMLAALSNHKVSNYTRIPYVLRESVKMLRQQEQRTERPPSCQQVIILLTDAVEENFTQIMRDLDPSGRIRLFVIWLHDVFGLRDNSREYGQWLGCTSDGLMLELETDSAVTELVMQILRVLERPLVAQRNKRLRVFSDVYAHMEDPRRAEYHWMQKERQEQAYRYRELRRHKEKFLSPSERYKAQMRQLSLDRYGYYHEGEDMDYRLQISVSVPVFDHTTSENITIQLAEEKKRNSTRMYPVNRLLGVAGIDVPIEHLKLILPYHELGAGGSLFILDHRGNIVLHDNTKPLFDGDILKPGYRTVDFLDLEQSGIEHNPRNYTSEWLEFRQALVINQPKGTKTMLAKNIFKDGMRAIVEMREYHWRRVLDHYTAVVVLPKYNRKHAVPEGVFTQKLATSAYETLTKTDFFVHPDWLYCRHVDPKFNERELEVVHFINRRMDEPNFAMKNLKHVFSPIKPTLFEKTYQCNEKLMARLCKEAVITSQWAEEHEDKDTERDCSTCELGSTTAFFATENGLTRWQTYHATSAQEEPPPGSEWSRGPSEPWYTRAAATPGTLVIHAPVTPIRKMRNTDARPPPLSTKYRWYTAARTLGLPEKSIVGVAGYHFHPQYLENVLRMATTDHQPCDDEDDCEAHCDGEDWSCVLIDDGGWIVAGTWRDPEELTEEDPLTEHLARRYPHALAALLNANIFKLRWIHDYQAVCFPFIDEGNSVGQVLPTILKTLWKSLSLLLYFTKELITVITVIKSGSLVSADTELEKEKRRVQLWKAYEREKYERLHDERVKINRTWFTACDRSRAFYELQRNPKLLDLLKRTPDRSNPCAWPVVGAVLPNTNLILLAIFNLCPHVGRPPLPDPLHNLPVHMDQEECANDTAAGKLACWRNRVVLPARAPLIQCYPHDYQQEEGYRQCGPWLPDPEPQENQANSYCVSNKVIALCLIHVFIFTILGG